MIYEHPAPDAPIRQGDIFRSLPRIDLDLAHVPVVAEDDALNDDDWLRVSETTEPIHAVVAMRPVKAIVITQNCDTIRANDIALCEIDRFASVDPIAKETKLPRPWMRLITKHSRENLKWFYLPPSPEYGFEEKMAADFRLILRVPRKYLEDNMNQLRIGTLNRVAREHFRERMSEFFRRYPYDEWYPLSKDELEAYKSEKPEPIRGYPWQE